MVSLKVFSGYDIVERIVMSDPNSIDLADWFIISQIYYLLLWENYYSFKYVQCLATLVI